MEVSNYSTGLHPTLLVEWEKKDGEDPKPKLVVKWYHNMESHIKEYMVYLNNWKYPIKRVRLSS
jgi:hypothetical protein